MKYSNLFADIFTWQSAYDSYEVLKRTRLYTCTCHFLPHKVYGSTQTNISGKNPEIWEILQQLQQIIYINDFFNSQVCHSFCPYSLSKIILFLRILKNGQKIHSVVIIVLH